MSLSVPVAIDQAEEIQPWAPCWFVAYAAPRSEFVVVDRLAEAGIEAYAPWETLWCINPRRSWVRKVVKLPLLPRYVFVDLDPTKPRADLVEAVRGVEGMLRSVTGRPLQVKGIQLDRIRRHQVMGLYDYTIEASATAKRKARKQLREMVREVEMQAPRQQRDHPFGPTYRVISK